jgi:hypothetical protein
VSIQLSDLKGKYVVSLGEGSSDLVADLNAEGVIAYGTDFDYTSSKLRALARKNKNISRVLNRYFFVDATRADTDVREVLGENFQADHIFSHTLLCCLSKEMAVETMVRAHHLLRDGGTFRSFIIHHWEGLYGKSPTEISTEEEKFLARMNQRFKREGLIADFSIFREGVATVLIMTKPR